MRLTPFWLSFNKKCMSGESKKKQAPGGGELLLSLPRPLQFLILARIPILELGRLLIDEVSPHFSYAIRRVLEEIALESLNAIVDEDNTEKTDTDACKQSSKSKYLSTCGRGAAGIATWFKGFPAIPGGALSLFGPDRPLGVKVDSKSQPYIGPSCSLDV
jgi:hypothetical protein